MKFSFKDLFNIYGPRLIGAAAGFISAKLAEKSITVDPASLITIATIVYGVVHKTASNATPVK